MSSAATARTNIGLGNVDNTSDATKNAATATLSNKTLVSPAVTGDITISGGITANHVNLLTAAKASIAKGLLPYSPQYLTGIVAFLDTNNLDLAEGASVSSWTDISGNGRHGVQVTGSLQPTFRISETFTNTTGGYVAAGDTADYLTMPLPASSTKVICAVVRYQSPFPTTSTFSVDSNNLVTMLGGRWLTWKKDGAGGTLPTGYSEEYSVPCLRMNSANSASFFVDGTLVDTYAPETSNLAAATSIQIGPGFGRMKGFVVLDYGRGMTDSEVADHTDMLFGHYGMTYRFVFVDRAGKAGAGYAPTLASEGLVIQKRGVRGKRPLVILNHQAGSTERVFLDAVEQRSILIALLEKGYVVAISRQWDPNGAENSWGNDYALQANVDLYNFALANFQVDTARVAMVGMSMGGLSTALAFPDGRIPLTGAACFDCVFDLKWAHDVTNGGVNAGGFNAGINTAYQIGGSGGVYAVATAGHDPRLLATTSFSGKRFAFFRNTDDVLVSPVENTFDFQAQIASVTTEEVITSYTTGAGHLGNIEASKALLLAFLERCFQ